MTTRRNPCHYWCSECQQWTAPTVCPACAAKSGPKTAAEWWAALPLAQQVALLAAAPLIAGPWGTLGAEYAMRTEVARPDRNAAFLVWSSHESRWVVTIDGDTWGTATTLKSAQKIADEELRAQGWVLL